jgi:plastocyanin
MAPFNPATAIRENDVSLRGRSRKHRLGSLLCCFAVAVVWALAVSCRRAPSAEQTPPEGAVGHGTIKGRVHLAGKAPENPVIRMRADPMCARLTAGKPTANDAVIVDAEGSLANAFVQLQGPFPEAASPPIPVTIDQRGCIYSPRMVGVQAGQPLRIQNSDPGLHNVHGVSAGADAFNIGQPIAGMVNEVRLKDEGMMRLQCDVHAWMVAWVGVVSHPYFAVTGASGTFEIRNVPAGTHTVQAWHELFGPLTSKVTVGPDGVADVDFVYSGEETRRSAAR